MGKSLMVDTKNEQAIDKILSPEQWEGFQLLMAECPSQILVLDLNFFVIRGNAPFGNQVKIQQGVSPKEWFLPEEHDRLDQLFSSLGAPGFTGRGEYRFGAPLNCWMQVAISPVTIENKVSGYLWVGTRSPRDQKWALTGPDKDLDFDEGWKLMLDLAPVGLAYAKVRGNSNYMNPRLLEMLGLTQEGTREDWFGGIHQEDVNRCISAMERLDNEGTPFEEEYRYKRPDGVWMVLSGRAVRVSSRAGTPVGIIGTAEDVTELKSRTEEKKVLLQELHHRTKNNLQIMSSLFSSGMGGDKKYGLYPSREPLDE